MERLDKIRRAEADSHREMYLNHTLFAPGSWLAKPVKTVLDLLPLFDGYREFCALDLGSGVGRNSIPVAQYFQEIPCRVDCVDILELAVRKLEENARQYGVSGAVRGIVSSIDDYGIPAGSYDLILAISVLEHIASKTMFVKKLAQIRDGLRAGGVVCLIVNTNVREQDQATGKELLAQFEVNLQTGEVEALLRQIFGDWEVIKHTVVHQKYEIPRETGMAQLETDVVTWAARRESGLTGSEEKAIIQA